MSSDPQNRAAGGRIVAGSAALALATVTAIVAGVIWVGTRAGEPRAAGNAACRDCNVVILLLDALRRDHLGCYGYGKATSPAIDAFAAGALRFERLIAQGSWTKPATGSILTGKYPKSHRFSELGSVLGDEMVTLQEALGGAGYATAAFIASRIIEPRSNLTQGFGNAEAAYRRRRGELITGSDVLTDEVIEWLGGANGKRNFVYVHYMDTHKPYHAPGQRPAAASGAKPGKGAAEEDGERGGGAPEGGPSARWDGGIASDLVGATGKKRLRRGKPSADGNTVGDYDAAIRFNDAQIGRLFDAMKRKGIWDDSIIVVTADHGEAFGEHGELGHYLSLHDEEIRVPFVMRVPGAAPRVVESVYGQVDIMPTLLALVGVDAPPDLDGIDMLAGARRVVFSEYDKGGTHLVSARADDAKVIHRLRTPRYACFDLAADPAERNDLSGGGDPRCGWLNREIDAFVADRPAASETRGIDFSDSDLRQLRALGYVE